LHKIKGIETMKKHILLLSVATALVANTEFTINSGKKDYTNSKTKTDGTTTNIKVSHKYENGKVIANFSKDRVDREHPMTKKPIETLEVEKYNINYNHKISQKLTLKTNYIKIIDNLAPTDQGKVFGIGASYKIKKGLGSNFKVYRSDYKTFNVNQYDIAVSKAYKLENRKLKLGVKLSSINIDGNKYGSYTFKDTSYQTTTISLKCNNTNGMRAKVGMILGDRMFSVLGDGQKVQHHAAEFSKTYMLGLGKKFGAFDLGLNYSVSKFDELPEEQKNVDMKVTSFVLNYKF
jgi:hypothetical protein